MKSRRNDVQTDLRGGALMRRRIIKKNYKLACLVLAIAMVATMMPMISAREDADPNHPVHDEACGYVEAVAAVPCGHQHDESCYDWELTCLETEHVHDASCLTLSCGLDEHVHSPQCEALVCGKEDHAHTQQCYALTCTEEHEHTTACETLGCGLDEHHHTQECSGITCGEEEHAHTQECWHVACGLSEHHHAQEVCLTKVLHCAHLQHDELCGYKEESAGHPCEYYSNLAAEQETEPELEPAEQEPAAPDDQVHDDFHEELPECDCGTETNEHAESCPLYDGPYCNCGFPDGPHDKSCPLYQEPIFTEITEFIDALPTLSEVRVMDLNDVRDVNEKVHAVRDMIVQELNEKGIEDSARLDIELGAERIEKYNALLFYTDECIRENAVINVRPGLEAESRVSEGFAAKNIVPGVPAAGPPPTATQITINSSNAAQGRVVINSNGAVQYNGVGSTGATNIANNTDYVITGTFTYNNTAASNPIITVASGVTGKRIWLNGVNITNRASTSNTANTGHVCILTTGATATIILVDGTSNTLVGGRTESGGALVKNGMTGTLTIQCEHADEPGHMCTGTETGTLPAGSCGRLTAEGVARHATAIGSSRDSVASDLGGFCNLYIRGGIIRAWNSSPEGNSSTNSHSPGIGSMCGTSFMRSGITNLSNPQMLSGQTSKNINITGGRVFAYGGNNCAGIGSGGWGGPVDGIYISDGAYVYAKGGTNSPGIGSGGGAESSQNVISPAYNVSNIEIKGGRTVVEAEGWPTRPGVYAGTLPASYYPYGAPGIGCGFSNYTNQSGYRLTGTLTNVVAVPLNEDWMAMVRQGVGNQTPQYIDGCPATGSINIIPDRYYTLVHFSGITKTASVNGAPNQTGLPASPIPVNLGDTIKYTINTANWTAETPRFTLTDKIPKGLTLVTTPGTYTPGMTWGAPDSDGRVTVQWPDQVTSGVFFFTVTVGSLQGDGERIYANMANLLPIDPGSPVVQLELPSGITYHRAEGYVDLIFYKLKNDYSSALQGARFELYKCTNASHIASGNHSAGGCTWDAASRYRAEQQSDAAGKVTFAKVPNDYYGYILVETAAPVGWKTPGAGSYVLISIGTDNAISMSGRGDFASSVILGPGSNPYPGYYKIPNNPTTVSITVKKVIGNYGSQSAAARAELASRVFIIQLGGSAKGEVALKHNETSAPMNVTMTTTTASVTVSETVPMEFSAGFTVSASITHADGTTGTQSGRQITISPGDSVVITVTNTYTPKPFFKGWNYIENLFYGLN